MFEKYKDIAYIFLAFFFVFLMLFAFSAKAQEFLEPIGSAYDALPQTLDDVKNIGQISKNETQGLFEIDTQLDPPCLGYVQKNFEFDGSYEKIKYACVLQEVSREYIPASPVPWFIRFPNPLPVPGVGVEPVSSGD